MMPIESSDSSMVDEYAIFIFLPDSPFLVQIPLWSMNTSFNSVDFAMFRCSDSSMVDEYPDWKGEWRMARKSSDSSMVDEYE